MRLFVITVTREKIMLEILLSGRHSRKIVNNTNRTWTTSIYIVTINIDSEMVNSFFLINWSLFSGIHD